MAECLKLQKGYPHGCAAFTHISPNIEMEERGIREDKGTAGIEDHRFTQVGNTYLTVSRSGNIFIHILDMIFFSFSLPQQNLVSLLETSMGYFEQAQRYEVMSVVAKLLQPFYEEARNSKVSHDVLMKILQIVDFGSNSPHRV